MKSDLSILEKELSYRVYGVFLKVGKEYGNFCREEVYQKACEEELRFINLNFRSKSPVDIFSKSTGQKIGTLIPDLVIENKIIIEIKVQKYLSDKSISQLVKYLELTKYEIGYLVNFGTSYTQIIRRIYSNSRKKLTPL